MNFAHDVLERLPAGDPGLIELAADGSRRTFTFGDVARLSGGLAGTLSQHGVGRGDVVMTLIGNRPEWVMTMVAALRLGAVALPCTEQLRPHDLRLRLEVAKPAAVVADSRNADDLARAQPDCPVLLVPDPALFEAPAPPPADLDPTDPALITFTSGTTGRPKAALHGQRYFAGQALQAEHWLAAGRGDLVWCTASSGWSKSARNVFIAPWLRGACALLHDGRFDPDERLAILRQEQVNVLCMAPTEYRVIAKHSRLSALPSLHGMVAAGEALNPEILETWRAAMGLCIRDGYGQTETGQITGMRPGGEVREGSMGQPLPGVRVQIDEGELVIDPSTVPTFFLGYLGEPRWPADGLWRTGDIVRQDDDGFLFFEGRGDDVIISSGYRIGPFEVESALVAHPAVAEAAVVAHPDEERGNVVRAVLVLAKDHQPSAELQRELQEHVKALTAPYKYPRVIEFIEALPKTSSGKVQRALLRDGCSRRSPGNYDAQTQRHPATEDPAVTSGRATLP